MGAAVQRSETDTAERDVINGFGAAQDSFVFSASVAIDLNTPISFIGDAVFSNNGNSEARLSDVGGIQLLEIDIDGDGFIGGNDMTVELSFLNGILSDANFIIV